MRQEWCADCTAMTAGDCGKHPLQSFKVVGDFVDFQSVNNLTKREYMATEIASGKNGNPKEIAEHAVMVADALIKALNAITADSTSGGET